MNDLKRIANALEHLAWSQIIHPEGCEICNARKKPIKQMPPSRTLTQQELAAHEARIRHARMMAGPEVPVGDSFRYRELNKERP